jgi:hypothetical protein
MISYPQEVSTLQIILISILIKVLIKTKHSPTIIVIIIYNSNNSSKKLL